MNRFRVTLGFTLLAVAGGSQLAAIVHAGPVFVFMVSYPAVTAGSGVPAISGLTVTSTKTGTSTWHLYAVDDNLNSFGIRSYSVTLSAVAEFDHRSPNATYVDENSSSQTAGFNETHQPNIGQFVAGQSTANSVQIGGFGRTASDFATQIVNETLVAQVTSGQWGTYGDNVYKTGGVASQNIVQQMWGGSGQYRSALLLAEGRVFNAAVPHVDAASIVLWTDASLMTSAIAPNYVLNQNPFDVPEPTTAVLLTFAAFACGSLRRRRS